MHFLLQKGGFHGFLFAGTVSLRKLDNVCRRLGIVDIHPDQHYFDLLVLVVAIDTNIYSPNPKSWFFMGMNLVVEFVKNHRQKKTNTSDFHIFGDGQHPNITGLHKPIVKIAVSKYPVF